MLKSVFVKAITPDPFDTENFVLYLLNEEDDVVLPVQISYDSTKVLTLASQKSPAPRPHVHDTMRRMVAALGGRIVCCIINFYSNSIYYACVRIERDGSQYDIDSKVTDAVSIAIRCEAPIYVESGILHKQGIRFAD